MPKPRVLEKYDVDESRCILCGICVDACPYDALRCGPDFELSHESRDEPLIDLLAISSFNRDTEISWIRKERDWLERAQAQGRNLEPGRFLPMLPASVASPANVAGNGHASGNGHVSGNGHSHDDHAH
jgi:ferredoxin